MKRMLLIVFVAIIGGFVVTHQLVAGKIGDQIDRMSDTMAAAGSISHGNIFVTPTGTALINDFVIYPNGSAGEMRIDQVAIRTGSLKALYDLGQTGQSGELPESLTVEFNGIQADLGEVFSPSGTGSNQPVDFFAAGCGDRTAFSFADRDNMGYSDLRSDMTLDYQFQQGPNRLTLRGEWVTPEMVGVDYLLDMQMPAGQNPMGMTINHIRFRVDDLGYVNAVMNYCARETGLDLPSYRQQHLAAWEAAWATEGIDPGEGFKTAYRDFIEQPDTLTLETYPDMNLMQAMMNPNPDALFQLLDPRIRANDGDPLPFRVSMAPNSRPEPDDEESSSEDTAEPTESEETATAEEAQNESEDDDRIQRLSRSEWAGHLNRPVWVTLNDGRQLEGVMLSLDGNRMEFQQHIFDGQMVMPLRLEQISDVYLKPSRR